MSGNIASELDRLLLLAKSSPALKQRLTDTKNASDPVGSFCAVCAELGFDIDAGGLLALGQESSDAKLRSVNGGGVNAIDGWDDAYEQFILTLEWT